MASHVKMVTATEVTPEMLTEFIRNSDGGRVDSSGMGGYIDRYDRTICFDPNTSLFGYEDEDIEECRLALGAEPKSDIQIQVFNPRDEISYKLTDEAIQAMISLWGGLRYRDIFGVNA